MTLKITSEKTVHLVVPTKTENGISVPQWNDMKIFTKSAHASDYVTTLKEYGIDSQLKNVQYNITHGVLYSLSFLGSTNYVVYPQRPNSNTAIKVFNTEHDARKYKFSIQNDDPIIVPKFF